MMLHKCLDTYLFACITGNCTLCVHLFYSILLPVSVCSTQSLTLHLFAQSIPVSVCAACVHYPQCLSLPLIVLLNTSSCLCLFYSISLPVSVCSAQNISLDLYDWLSRFVLRLTYFELLRHNRQPVCLS